MCFRQFGSKLHHFSYLKVTCSALNLKHSGWALSLTWSSRRKIFLLHWKFHHCRKKEVASGNMTSGHLNCGCGEQELSTPNAHRSLGSPYGSKRTLFQPWRTAVGRCLHSSGRNAWRYKKVRQRCVNVAFGVDAEAPSR